MAKETPIPESESNWSLIQSGPSSHNLNINPQQYFGHCILRECLYNLTMKGLKGSVGYPVSHITRVLEISEQENNNISIRLNYCLHFVQLCLAHAPSSD